MCVYSENKNADDTYFMLYDFVEKQKKFGFSFHNTQNNAYLLFLNHYNKFTKNETHIKPFLLVDNTFKVEEKINLTYDYKDIKVFESNIFSMGYVVAKYSMGYDFNKLDFLFFSDSKLSSQDISQCIGRGTRPDSLGENGKNKDKKLLVSLPVYIDNDNSYDTIIEVLKYLLYEIEIIFNDIEFKNRNHVKVETNEKNITNDETENIKSILLNLLEINIVLNFDKTKKFLKDNNIKTKKDYYALCDNDKRFTKTPEIDFNKKFTNWIDFLNIERKYYDLETCKIKVCEHLKQNEELKKHYLNLSHILKKLCEMDCLYPPGDLWLDYYNIMDLNEIIVIKHKKFKK